MKRAMVKFKGWREKDAMACGIPGVLDQNTMMESPLLWEILGKSQGSHYGAERGGGMYHGNCCRQETTCLHAISGTKTGWSSLTHNQVLHQALARSFSESKVQFIVEDIGPFERGLADQTAD